MSHPAQNPSVRGPVRRLVALAAVPALALGGLAATAGPAAAAADPRPTAIGATWLAGELTDGAVVGEFGPDYGLSIDAALALDEVGAQPAAVAAVSTRLQQDIDAYVTGEAFGDAGSLYVGAAAKAAVAAQATDGDPAAFGGRNLIADVEGRVGTSGAAAGRISDQSTFGEFANTIGQSYAARALDEAGSDSAASVTDYLLLQQCAAGFFRLDLGATATDTCGASAEPSVDVTALALLNLEGLQDDPEVATSRDRALTWLESVQAGDGSFGSDAQITAPNANSTGLAGWALGTYGRAAAAQDAAVWVRGRQADDPAACASALSGATGAIAYDDAALARGRSAGIESNTRDQFRRASAQALPSLAYAPAGATPQVTNPSASFRRPGAREVLGATGLAPGQSACITGPGTQVLKAVATGGGVNATVTLPRSTGTAAYRVVTGAGTVGTATFRVLGATKLGVDYKRRPKRGTNQRVVVKGLVQGESVAVTSRGSVKDRGTANAQGRFVSRFKVGGKVGKAGLRVRGEFADRTASRSFVVVKGR